MRRDITLLLEQIIQKYFIENRPDKLKTEGIREIKRLIKRYHISYQQIEDAINPLIKKVENELNQKFFQEHLSPYQKEIRTELSKLVSNYKLSTSITQKKINKIIVDILNSDEKNIDKALEQNLKKIKLEDRHIKTEIFTTKLALNNMSRAVSYENTDIEYLKYSGPSGTVRPFCKEHINQIYTLQEVKDMRNDFGQPALYFAGGYNCRHRWTAVVNTSLAKRKIEERLNQK